MRRWIAPATLGGVLLLVLTACIPIPLPGPAYWWITPAIQLRGTTQPGQGFLSQEAEVEYAGGTVFLSSSCDGSGDIWVDDRILIRVTQPDGTTAEHALDFSFGCQGYISTLEALDLTSLFAIGRNRVHVESSDICGGHVGSTGLYLTLEHGAVLEEATLKGLDVNATQGSNINWPAVYDAGYRFVYVKATSGDAAPQALRNDHFENQADGAKAAGLVVGIYHFGYAGYGNKATDEAEYFLEVAGDYVRSGYLRPALDIEDDKRLPASQWNSALSAEELTAWVDEWMDTVEWRTGVEPILYVSSSYAKDHLLPTIGEYDVWIADWDCTTDGTPNLHGIWGEWSFWQYWAPEEPGVIGCGHNLVAGIGEDVDLDVFNGGMTQLSEYVIEDSIPFDDSLLTIFGGVWLENRTDHSGITVELYEIRPEQRLLASQVTDISGDYEFLDVPADCEYNLSFYTAADYCPHVMYVACPRRPLEDRYECHGGAVEVAQFVLPHRKCAYFDSVYQPDGSRSFDGSGTVERSWVFLPGTHTQVGESCFHFQPIQDGVVPPTDICYDCTPEDPMGILFGGPWSHLPPIVDMGPVPLENVTVAPPPSEYRNDVPAVEGHTYCVLMHDESHYAKFHITEISMPPCDVCGD